MATQHRCPLRNAAVAKQQERDGVGVDDAVGPLPCRRTMNDVVAEVPGRFTVNVPVRPIWPPMSTSAFFVWLISIASSRLFCPVAATLTWRPPPDGAVVTLTGGRGLHATGGGVGAAGVMLTVPAFAFQAKLVPQPGLKMPIITVYVPVAAPPGTFQVTG